MHIVRTPYHLSVQRHNIGMQLHTHDTMIEMELLVEGCGEQILNGHRYPIQRGSFWISRPQDFHAVSVPKGTQILNVQFKPSFLSRDLLAMLLNYAGDICLSLSEADFSILHKSLETIFSEYENPIAFSSDMIQRQIELIVLRVFRLLAIKPIEKKESTQNPLIEKTILFLRSNFSENPSLSATAELVHLNADYFATQFRKHTGKTYYAYLTDLKMEHAKKLTLETELTLSVVAFKCGFGNQSNFLRQFKNYFGCTPTEMRSQKRYHEEEKA